MHRETVLKLSNAAKNKVNLLIIAEDASERTKINFRETFFLWIIEKLLHSASLKTP